LQNQKKLQNKNIVLGVTGSIAAYKACDIASTFVKLGANVDVIMTESAKRFVAALTFSSITSNNVHDMWSDVEYKIGHISLAKKADCVLIAPCTANMIAKLAHGLCDDLLSTTCLATKSPIIIAPAMNTAMLENIHTQENINKLKEKGVFFIEPACGRLACGDVGNGKLASVEDIVDYVCDLLNSNEKLTSFDSDADNVLLEKDFLGKQIIVSAGATIAPIDPVRYITNHSSGKMGYAICEAAVNRGAKVYLVSGKTLLETPNNVEFFDVNTNEDMYLTIKDLIDKNKIDYYISAAAPCDFVVKEQIKEKIKKVDTLTLELIKAKDILLEISKLDKKPKLIGFAAETRNVLEYAKEKLIKKSLDMIVANDVSENKVFGQDFNKADIVLRDGRVISTDRIPKLELANIILDTINKI